MTIAVVYVHGLWMVGLEGSLIRRRLSAALHATAPFFRYPSVWADLEANARRLASLVARIDADTVHLVGHSMGGLVILKMFEDGAANVLPPGRVVLLGSPARGSRAAQILAGWWIGKLMLGRSVADSMLKDAQPRWGQTRELGLIAGSRNVGIGRLINTHKGPNDGTVFVDETYINGAKEHLVLPVSHIGLPLSPLVAEHTVRFLLDGSF